MPAFPKKIIVEGNEGNTVILHLRGDEHLKYAIEDMSGYTAVQDSMNCWRYLILGKSGLPEISNILVSDTKIEKLTQLLTNTPKGLLPLRLQTMDSHGRQQEISNTESNDNKVVGERKALIILAEFPDRKFHCNPQDFEMLFNMQDYNINNATGSVADYFNEVSEGQLSLVSTIIGPFQSQRIMSYYGKNSNIGGGDSNPFALFQEAIDYAKTTVNLEDFDCNSDGFIDNIHIIYAGYGEEAGASANSIWAHECTFSPIEILSGLKIDRYSCSPELRDNKGNMITTIGPPCHEICHALGAMDFYDTDYSQRGEYQGTSVWDIMASGSWNNGGATPAWPNPYVRAYNFGWSDPEILDSNGTFDFLDPSKRKIYRINTPEQNDYFLLEYRDGKYFSSSEPGSGLLIFHIGPDIEKNSQTNSINATFPQQCYPVCASSNYPLPSSNSLSYGNINSPSCAFSDTNGYTVFDKYSIPGAFSFSGKECEFAITNIHEEFDNVIFSFSTSAENKDSTDVRILWRESFNRVDALSDWEQENIEGHAIWSRYNDMEDPSTNYYISLRAEKGTFNPHEIKTKLISPEFTLITPFDVQDDDSSIQPLEVIFSVKIRNQSKSISKWEFIFFKGDKVISDFDIDLSPGKEWTQLTEGISFDYCDIDCLRLIIRTNMELNANSKLELTDLVIHSQESADEIPITMDKIQYNADSKTFDIYGREIYHSDLNKMPKGIYLMQTAEGLKKILIGH